MKKKIFKPTASKKATATKKAKGGLVDKDYSTGGSRYKVHLQSADGKRNLLVNIHEHSQSSAQKVAEEKYPDCTVVKVEKLFEKGGKIELSPRQKLDLLGIGHTDDFGDKYRSWIDKENDKNNKGSYVGYQMSLAADTILLIAQESTTLYEIVNYKKFAAKPLKFTNVFFKNGGPIENNYSGKGAKEVWDAWRGSQRYHFLNDHFGNEITPAGKEDYVKKAYNFLPSNVKKALVVHIADGQYEDGGKIKTKSDYQKARDKYDHLTEVYMDYENNKDSEEAKLLKRQIQELELDMHIYEREYEDGGKTPSSMLPARFTIDGGEYFSGYHNPGENWNGWAVPVFDKDETERILDHFGNPYKWEDGRLYVALDWYQGQPENEIEFGEPINEVSFINHEGKEISGYQLGAYNWVWSAEGDYDENEDGGNELGEGIINMLPEIGKEFEKEIQEFGINEVFVVESEIDGIHITSDHDIPHDLRERIEKRVKDFWDDYDPLTHNFANGGPIDNLQKELHKLQRDLNSSRLSTYTDGDNSPEEMDRKNEREIKLARFNEVLQLLRERDGINPKSFRSGGRIPGKKQPHVSYPEFLRKISAIGQFLPHLQANALTLMFGGEEKEHAIELVDQLTKNIQDLPATYGTESQSPAEKIAYLHYFSGDSDWYIVEKDKGSQDDFTPGQQHQAFGYVVLNGDIQNAEWGYISIVELLSIRSVELDFYFLPQPMGPVIDRLERGIRNVETKTEHQQQTEAIAEIINNDPDMKPIEGPTLATFLMTVNTSRLPDNIQKIVTGMNNESAALIPADDEQVITLKTLLETKYPLALTFDPTKEETQELIEVLQILADGGDQEAADEIEVLKLLQ